MGKYEKASVQIDSHKSHYFQIHIFLHTCATYYELPSLTSTMGKNKVDEAPNFGLGIIQTEFCKAFEFIDIKHTESMR